MSDADTPSGPRPKIVAVVTIEHEHWYDILPSKPKTKWSKRKPRRLVAMAKRRINRMVFASKKP